MNEDSPNFILNICPIVMHKRQFFEKKAVLPFSVLEKEGYLRYIFNGYKGYWKGHVHA
jgi:hypothetical protein